MDFFFLARSSLDSVISHGLVTKQHAGVFTETTLENSDTRRGGGIRGQLRSPRSSEFRGAAYTGPSSIPRRSELLHASTNRRVARGGTVVTGAATGQVLRIVGARVQDAYRLGSHFPPTVRLRRASFGDVIRAGEVADPAVSTRDTLEKRASVIGVDDQTVHLATTRADGARNEAALNRHALSILMVGADATSLTVRQSMAAVRRAQS